MIPMTNALKKVPAVKFPGTAAAMIAVASSQLGYREGHDSSGWNNDNVFGRWYGMNKVSWCYEFQSWAASVSGNAKNIPRGAYTPDGAKWFQNHGQWHSSPKVGDLAFYYSPSQGRIHHIDLVVAVFDGGYYSVGGNTNNSGSAQGDGVYKLKRRNSSVGSRGGFGRPKYTKITKSAPVWDISKGYPGTGAFVVGKSHPAVPIYREALAAIGFGHKPVSISLVYDIHDEANTKNYQLSRHWAGSDADGIPGPQTFRDVLAGVKH